MLFTWTSAKHSALFLTASSWMNWPDKTRGVVYEVGRKLAYRLHAEGSGQWVLLRLAACHKWGPSEVSTGPHAAQQVALEEVSS